MEDQYGNKIPEDLIFLERKDHLTEEHIDRIFSVDWYVFEERILVSKSSLPRNIANRFAPANLDEEQLVKVFYVDHPIKRYNIVDGFFNA